MHRPLLIRSVPLLAALALGAGAAPLLAQGSAAYFTAELAAPASKTQFAAGGVVWHCEGTACRAARSNVRALRICTALRREAGTVVSFSVDGAAVESDMLARCNG